MKKRKPPKPELTGTEADQIFALCQVFCEHVDKLAQDHPLPAATMLTAAHLVTLQLFLLAVKEGKELTQFRGLVHHLVDSINEYRPHSIPSFDLLDGAVKH
jgi:hypothetical protein